MQDWPGRFIAASGSSDTVVEAMKQGACDYLPKPLDLGGRPRAAGAPSRSGD
jgi:DNA-binding NtrC family response regulator